MYGEVADKVDLALCMTVNPGWGGQRFIEASIGRLGALRRLLRAVSRSRSTAASRSTPGRAAARPGAGVFVAGNAVFGSSDPAAAYLALAEAVGDPRR